MDFVTFTIGGNPVPVRLDLIAFIRPWRVHTSGSSVNFVDTMFPQLDIDEDPDMAQMLIEEALDRIERGKLRRDLILHGLSLRTPWIPAHGQSGHEEVERMVDLMATRTPSTVS